MSGSKLHWRWRELFQEQGFGHNEAMEIKSAQVDWSACPLVESRPSVMAGTWVLRGTRMPVDAIVGNYQAGEDESQIAELFEISPSLVSEVLAYAAQHDASVHLV